MNVEITWGDDLAAIPRNKNSICVVIDALRASTSIAMLLHRGARLIRIIQAVDEALTLKRSFPEALLCGERGGIPPVGFDHGNSPVEFSTANVSQKLVILTTTNFTRIAVEVLSKGFPSVYCGAFINRAAVAGAIHRKAMETGCDLLLVAAGVKQDAYEDLACAMYVAKHLSKLGVGTNITLMDGVSWDGGPVHSLVEESSTIRAMVLARSRHASFLGTLGPRFLEDVGLSLQLDTIAGVVPWFDPDVSGFVNAGI